MRRRYAEGIRTRNPWRGHTNWDKCVDTELRDGDGKPIITSRQSRNILKGDPGGRETRKTKEFAEKPSAPPLRRKNDDGTTSIIPPAEDTAGDALVIAKQFLASAVSHMSAQDKNVFYCGLSLHIEDILNKTEEVKPESPKPPKGGTRLHEPSVADAPATAAQPTQPAVAGTPNRKADLAVLLEWASKYCGTAWHARKDCKGRLTSNKLDYINGLLNELADTGQIPFEDQGGRRMGQYSLFYSRPGRL
jgi:hypothetical protein